MPVKAQAQAVDARALQAAEARAEAALAQAAQEQELRRSVERRIREELVADFTPMRADLRTAEARLDQLKGVLAEAREQHAAELAAQRQQHADALAEVREQHAIEFRVQDAHHELEVAGVLAGQVAGQPGAGRAVQAERRRLKAELDRATAESERDRREHLAVRRDLEQVKAELDRATAERDALAERLAPPPEAEPLVAVRWLKDSPDGGAHVGTRVYRGKGPRFRRRTLLLGGHPTGGDTSEVSQLGDVHAIPRGAAEVLSRAGYVHVLSAELRDLPALAPRPHPMTVEQLRAESAALAAEADAFERAIAAEQDQGAGAAEQV